MDASNVVGAKTQSTQLTLSFLNGETLAYTNRNLTTFALNADLLSCLQLPIARVEI